MNLSGFSSCIKMVYFCICGSKCLFGLFLLLLMTVKKYWNQSSVFVCFWTSSIWVVHLCITWWTGTVDDLVLSWQERNTFSPGMLVGSLSDECKAWVLIVCHHHGWLWLSCSFVAPQAWILSRPHYTRGHGQSSLHSPDLCLPPDATSENRSWSVWVPTLVYKCVFIPIVRIQISSHLFTA